MREANVGMRPPGPLPIAAELTFVRGGSAQCPKIVITLMGLREFPALRVE
jgi:hypothetical protein